MKAVFELAEKYYPQYWSKDRLDVLLAKKKLTQEEYNDIVREKYGKSKSVSTLLDTKNCIKNKISCCKIFLARLIYLCSCFFQLYNDD